MGSFGHVQTRVVGTLGWDVFEHSNWTSFLTLNVSHFVSMDNETGLHLPWDGVGALDKQN